MALMRALVAYVKSLLPALVLAVPVPVPLEVQYARATPPPPRAIAMVAQRTVSVFWY